MKKILFILITAVFLGSCGSSNVEREARKTVNGDWLLTDITFPGNPGDFNVTLFQDASVSCLENSEWNFISNNNTGSYNATLPQCDADPRFFAWSVEEVQSEAGRYDFMLKPTDSDSTGENQGFRINIVSLTDTQMVWEHTISFEGDPFTIRMNFTKI